MGERGGATMRVLREGTDLVITVADTGPRHPRGDQGPALPVFVTAGKRGGTGLGLAIVKKIVDEHRITGRPIKARLGRARKLASEAPRQGCDS
jgi:nitrogen fixation/metabolism regulation signal transduction histidine kinase